MLCLLSFAVQLALIPDLQRGWEFDNEIEFAKNADSCSKMTP